MAAKKKNAEAQVQDLEEQANGEQVQSEKNEPEVAEAENVQEQLNNEVVAAEKVKKPKNT